MKVLALDTETTSLINSRLMALDHQPYLIQFAGYVVDLAEAKILQKYMTFVRPPRQDLLTEKISSITRITWEMLAGQPSFSEVYQRIEELIESVPAVAAHNLTFDKDVLDIESERIGRKIKWPDRLICSVEATEFCKGHRLSLSNLYEHLFGMKFEDAHRADADTEALIRCLVEMFKREWI